MRTMISHAVFSTRLGLGLLTMAGGCDLLVGVTDLDNEGAAATGGQGGSGAATTSVTGGTGGGGTVATSGGTGGAGGGGGTTTTTGGAGGTGPVGSPGAPCPEAGMLGCAGNAQKSKLICGSDLKWAQNGTCDGEDVFCDTAAGLDQGTCKPAVPVCVGKSPGDVVCEDLDRLTCGPDLVTTEYVETCPYLCSGGACTGECVPGIDKQCSIDGLPQSCDRNGVWQDDDACAGQACNGGVCVGVCAPMDTRCSGNTPQTCGGDGQWQSGAACAVQAQICVAGACAAPPSCNGMAATCGPAGNESCCALSAVTGGTYNRSNDPLYPATVSDFRLDRFEITVGRFRAFVAAYPGSKPADGAGAHPQIAGSGWNGASWNASLPPDQQALKTAVKCQATYQTWTDVDGANENLPMNCINWYDAFAFCAWDGGRLPTEAEWNYAAAGGNEQRKYPWSNPPSSTTIDVSYAVYGSASLLVVGSKSPKGDGKWGQSDLAGSVSEWSLDLYANPYPSATCDNCANLDLGSARVFRGGTWLDISTDLVSSSRVNFAPTYRGSFIGARCARTPG